MNAFQELYEKAEEYWANAPRDDDGMLGGFAHLHKPDITQSRNFLSGLHKKVSVLLSNRVSRTTQLHVRVS